MTIEDSLVAGGADGIEAQLRALLTAAPAPTWVSQVVDGVSDLEFDVLESTAAAARRRSTFRSAGRVLSIVVSEQERRLEGARTGRLIRMIVDTGRSAAYCLSVVPGQHIVAFLAAADPDAIRSVDRSLIRLVDQLREDIGLSSQNPGGLVSVTGTAPLPPNGHGSGLEDVREPLTRSGDPTAAPPDIEVVFDGTALHWLGLLRDRDVVFTADRFADPGLAGHFRLMSAAARRRFYREFAGEFVYLTGRLDRLVRSPLGGPLERMVLDVEQGALTANRLGPREYLLGVTLNQDQVGAVEDGMGALAGRILR